MKSGSPRLQLLDNINDIIISSTLTEEDKCNRIKKLLLEKPEEINRTYEHERNALHLACSNDCQKIAALLIEAFGCPLNSIDDYGNTPLHYAAMIDNSIITLYLCNLPNIEVNIQNKKGNTPLHHAAMAHSEKNIKILYRVEKCELYLKNNDDLTPKGIILQAFNLDSASRESLLQAFHPISNSLIELYEQLFPNSIPKSSDKEKPKKIDKEFDEPPHKIHFFLPLHYDNINAKKNSEENAVISEVDFIYGRFKKIQQYVNANGGNADLQIYSSIFKKKMPLVFMAFIHKQEKILIFLIENNGMFNLESLKEINCMLDKIEDDLYIEFIHAVQSRLSPPYLKWFDDFNSALANQEVAVQKLIVDHGLTRYFDNDRLFMLSADTIAAFFNNELKTINVATYIYDICSGSHPSERLQFDAEQLNTCAEKLLTLLSPDEIFHILLILIPHFSRLQRLFAMYLIKQVLVYNAEFGYELSLHYFTLKMKLEPFYDETLVNELFDLYQSVWDWRNSSIFKSYRLFDHLCLLHPSLRNHSIHEYLTNAVQKLATRNKTGKLEQKAKVLSREFRLLYIQALQHCDLREIKSENRNTVNIRLSALSEFVKDFVLAQTESNRDIPFRLFIHCAYQCLTDNEFPRDINAALAIYNGLIPLEKDLLKTDHEKTFKIHSKLAELFNPNKNFSTLRQFLEETSHIIPSLNVRYREILSAQEQNGVNYLFDFNRLLINFRRKENSTARQSNTDLAYHLHKNIRAQPSEIQEISTMTQVTARVPRALSSSEINTVVVGVPQRKRPESVKSKRRERPRNSRSNSSSREQKSDDGIINLGKMEISPRSTNQYESNTTANRRDSEGSSKDIYSDNSFTPSFNQKKAKKPSTNNEDKASDHDESFHKKSSSRQVCVRDTV